MGTPERRYYAVFNGEIYNYVELREELRRLGHDFTSNSDTEVLLHAYSEWASGAFPRLIGMFAFALLDVKRRTLLLVRDFFGIKPLYYRVGKGALAFASEVRALLEFDVSRPHANAAALLLYLRHGLSDQGSQTLLSDVYQVPAAHYLEFALDSPQPPVPVRYWEPEIDGPRHLTFTEAAGQLRELFLESVRLHLRSDVPVGAALSGGVDSSSIVLTMRHLDKSVDIHAFSYIAADSAISEEYWADMAGKAAGAQVHKIQANPNELVRDLEELISAQEQPFGSTSLYAQFRVFSCAREAGIKVMLDGQGADELLGGYRYYLAARLASLIRQNKLVAAGKFLYRASQLAGVRAPWVLTRAADYLLPKSLQAPLRRVVGKEMLPAWLRGDWFMSRGATNGLINYAQGCDVLRHILLRTITETSLPHLLRYEDRNSMAFSIESRVPFLTPQLANFILSLPEDYILAPDGTSKAVFRAAMAGIVPEPILKRRDKVGFATPEHAWLQNLNPWVETTLASDSARTIPFFDLARMQREWTNILEGRRSFDNRVWRWLNVICWSQQFGVQYS